MENAKNESSLRHAELVSASVDKRESQKIPNQVRDDVSRVKPKKTIHHSPFTSHLKDKLFTCSAKNPLTTHHSPAFTLAEVLITLGIIGIVAALTIPNLVKEYRKQVIETRLKGFYSEINQAVKLSSVENGDFSTWTYPSGFYDYDGALTFFNTYLKNYMRYTKVETHKESPWPTYGINVYLTNGSAFHLSGNDGKGLWITFYPVASKKTETGRDVFLFASYPANSKYKLIQPYGYTLSKNNLMNDTVGCASTEGYAWRRFCAAIIMQNNWKIPDDYPWLK